MRKNIFELLEGKQVEIRKEYFAINKLFEHTNFCFASSICEYVNSNLFTEWKFRNRYISLTSMMSDLEITEIHMISMDKINTDNLLLYIELIINVMTLIDMNRLTVYDMKTYKTLMQNIYDLLEDLNYKIKILSDSRLVIVEKDKVLTAVAETNNNISDSLIEYRRFALKGKLKEKKDILNLLAGEIEPLKSKFKGTTYWGMMDDVQFMLNNIHIRHNNKEGKLRKEYIVNLSDEELEKLYDKTFDMILGIYVVKEYLDNKNEIDNLKKEMN